MGVGTVVARWSYLKSVKMRWQRSIAASSIGRPAENDGAAYAANAGVMVTRGDRRRTRALRKLRWSRACALRARPVPKTASAPNARLRGYADRPDSRR